MKLFRNFKSTALLLALVALSVASCKKNKEPEVTPAGKFANVTAKRFAFDGAGAAEFKSTSAVIAIAGPIFTLTAVRDGLKETLSIALYGVSGTGKYTLDEGNSTGNGAILKKEATSTDPKQVYSTGEKSNSGGGVEITKLTDTHVEGTFYVIAHNSEGKEAYMEQGSFSGPITTVKTGK